jgi:tRNA(Ile)-lysidine synthase
LLTRTSQTQPLTLAEFSAALASLAHFESSPFLAVAVSGGPDSLALALLADRWARERGGYVCALTVDHRLRAESGAEARTVQAWLSAREIRHEILAWTGEKPKTGIQEAARTARYRLLAGWCHEHGCLNLLTAHHGDDQIETHLIRRRAHSGPGGLAGMSAIRELAGCRLLRPLLGVARARLQTFLEIERQPFLTDPSNRDPAFERSRLRGSDGTRSAAINMPHMAAAIRELGGLRAAREREVNIALARLVHLHPAGFAVLDPAILGSVSRAVVEPALSALVSTIGGLLYPCRRERIARLCDVLGDGQRRGYTLGGCRFVRWRGRVLVMRELARATQPAGLNPGTIISWDRRYEVSLRPEASTVFTIAYLGSAGVTQLNRLASRLKGRDLPRLVFPSLPAAWDGNGIVAVPHLDYRRKGIAVVPHFIFRPANPLTQAGFAVV